MERTEVIETTLGDLIVALTEEASLYVRSESEANELVALILADILRGMSPDRRCQYWH